MGGHTCGLPSPALTESWYIYLGSWVLDCENHLPAYLVRVPLPSIYKALQVPGLFPLGKAEMEWAVPSPQEAHLLEGVMGPEGAPVIS